MTWVVWAWLATLPGFVLTAVGRGSRPGVASLFGPLAMACAGLAWILGDREPVAVRFDAWLPGIENGALVLRADGLAAAMLAVVGTVSTCVYVYSLAYLRGDPGQRRFFVFLDLFVAAMGLLVLAGTLPVLLIGWMGVGLASFLLITFWRDNPGSLAAGLQALAANAVGDAALIAAIVLLPAGELHRLADLHAAASPTAGGATLIAALLVLAASAKSAQGPLYFWLPSAMAGPTPVSALIHAATMVAAGVYLLVRTSPLLALAPGVLTVTALLGTATAVLSAIASLQQSNLKRGLAYSTVSQLGYMFAGIGFGAPFAAFFHLVTHAAFKALLFLSAGAVIHSVDGEEELAQLGGLRRTLPAAALTFLIGSLCLIGVPVVTSGAYSKDAILEAGIAQMPLVGWTLVLAVFLTGLYSGRLYFAVFGGKPRERAVHPAGPLLLGPLLPLAVASVLLGLIAWPRNRLAQLIEPLATTAPVHAVSATGLIAGALGLLGFAAAARWCRRAGSGARLPSLSIAWVDAGAHLGMACATGVARFHDGRLGRYVLTTAVGVALLVYLVTGPIAGG